MYKVGGKTLKWLESYLTERQQAIWVDCDYVDLVPHFHLIFIRVIMLLQVYVNRVPHQVTAVCQVGTTHMNINSIPHQVDYDKFSWYHILYQVYVKLVPHVNNIK